MPTNNTIKCSTDCDYVPTIEELCCGQMAINLCTGCVYVKFCDEDGTEYIVENCPESEDVYGCTDPDSLNYNPLATINDGSCLYPDPLVITSKPADAPVPDEELPDCPSETDTGLSSPLNVSGRPGSPRDKCPECWDCKIEYRHLGGGLNSRQYRPPGQTSGDNYYTSTGMFAEGMVIIDGNYNNKCFSWVKVGEWVSIELKDDVDCGQCGNRTVTYSPPNQWGAVQAGGKTINCNPLAFNCRITAVEEKDVSSTQVYIKFFFEVTLPDYMTCGYIDHLLCPSVDGDSPEDLGEVACYDATVCLELKDIAPPQTVRVIGNPVLPASGDTSGDDSLRRIQPVTLIPVSELVTGGSGDWPYTSGDLVTATTGDTYWPATAYRGVITAQGASSPDYTVNVYGIGSVPAINLWEIPDTFNALAVSNRVKLDQEVVVHKDSLGWFFYAVGLHYYSGGGL